MVKILRIELDWKELGGCIYVKGKIFKDAIIWWGGACNWNWNVCKTSHSTGITEKVALSIILLKCTHVVISRGMDSRIAFPSAAITDMFKAANIQYFILSSVDAVRVYNILHDENKRVAIILHSAC